MMVYMVEMNLMEDTSTLVPYKIQIEKVECTGFQGESFVLGKVLEDLPCEGEYFGDPTLEQSSLVRLNLGASSKRESIRDTFVEPSSSIGNHINWNFVLI